MSRTLKEIYDEIITEKQTFSSLDTLLPNPDTAQTFLNDLTTSSKVAVWRLMFWVVAFVIWGHEQIFEAHTTEINAIAEAMIPGVLKWYVEEAKKFQNGYELEWIDSKYQYADTTSVDAVASKIVTQAAAVESAGDIIIKVAKGTIGSFSVLSTAELVSFQQYIEKIKFAGTVTTLINESADDLKLAYTIYYDPLVIELDSSTPQRAKLISDGTYVVEEAITNHIQGLPFNSKLKIVELTDAIQNAEGVLNVVANEVQARYGAVPYADITTETDQSYLARAGYLAMATNFGLDEYYNYPTDTVATLTYIAG